MKHALKTGISFGLTSGTITTLGLIVGLHSGTHSKIVVIGGIITIAIADAFSDALGIHVSEESENIHTQKQIWASTIVTFLSKFIFAFTFLIPLVFLPLEKAILVSIAWGFSVLTMLSYILAKAQREKPWKIILEHLLIVMVVIAITHYIGDWIAGIGK
ncbi:VIT1/CCC1 transporter family protein, partial [Dissulfuribacter thermophilus]|uniref:VIT1/CCC1 transporter family protein n=1 Tax=Dissulfuribacter thermophilus TaxID=1156395 RepID=UPI0009F432E5